MVNNSGDGLVGEDGWTYCGICGIIVSLPLYFNNDDDDEKDIIGDAGASHGAAGKCGAQGR